MKRYFFVVQCGDNEYDDFRGKLLPSDSHASDYAARVVRELRESGAFCDPDLTMIVKDIDRGIILQCPFEGFPAVEPGHGGSDDGVRAGLELDASGIA
jgi:hypothetical protein